MNTEHLTILNYLTIWTFDQPSACISTLLIFPHFPNNFFKLIRLGEDSCLFSLVCDSLPGNICGSYALSFNQISSEDSYNNSSIDVCYQGQLYEQWIKSFDQMEINFWTIDQGNAHRKTLVSDLLISNCFNPLIFYGLSHVASYYLSKGRRFIVQDFASYLKPYLIKCLTETVFYFIFWPSSLFILKRLFP